METLGAVVVGAVITGFSSCAVASQQADSTREEALWTQRIMAYSQFIADSDYLHHTYESFIRAVVASPARRSGEAIATLKKPVEDALNKANLDASMVALVGSTRNAVIVQRVMTIDYGRYQLVKLFEPLSDPNLPEDLYKNTRTDLINSIANKERSDLLAEFTVQAREDVNR